MSSQILGADDAGNPIGHMGWVNDRQAIETYMASLPFQTLMAAGPDIAAADDEKDFFLWDAEKAYLDRMKQEGIPIPWAMDSRNMYLLNHHQLTNDCTSHGSSGAMEDLQMAAIMWRQSASEFFPIASEPLYAGAIVTIMRSRGDNGAYTGAPLDYAKKYGFLARQKYGDIDLTLYSKDYAHGWTIHGGVPSSLIDSEAKHLLRTDLPIKNFDDANALIRQGYSIVGGSNQGFTGTRDKDGFCRPSGSWAHCTRFRGRRTGKKPGLAYGQSWGPGMPGGPLQVTMDDGRPVDLPEGTFFVDPQTFNHMVTQGEFYALSGEDGFSILDNKMY